MPHRPSPARRQPQPGLQGNEQGYYRRRWTAGGISTGGTPAPPPASSTYLRPGGVDTYRRPGGVDRYLRP